MSSRNTSRLVRVCPICLFLIPAFPWDDQKTPSTEHFLDENRLSGIINHSDTKSCTTDRFRLNADHFYILQPSSLLLYQ